MKTKQFLLILLAVLLPLTTFADVWQDPETKVNYEYTVGVKEASVKSGKYSAGSPDATGDIVILSKFSVDNVEYSVTSIGKSAFYYCTDLTSVTIPNSVTNIGESAFFCCRNLSNINIPYGVTNIANDVFRYCSGITSIVLPESVTSIGDFAFERCEGLISLAIPSSVTSIGRYAFEDCDGLTNVNIQEGVISIGESAFRNCSNLLSVTVPSSVTSLGKRTFYYCESLTNVTIPYGLTQISDEAFYYCISLTDIIIPQSVTSIGKSAFKGCEKLSKVTVPQSVTSIGSSAFSGCSSLTGVVIPNGVSRIDYSTFYDCASLTSVTIPNSVTSIEGGAFSGCSGLTSVTIPSSVTSIGSEAFYYCNSLKSITSLIKEPFKISYVFDDETYSTATLYIPKGTVESYKATDGWKNFETIEETDITVEPGTTEEQQSLTQTLVLHHGNGTKTEVALDDKTKVKLLGDKVLVSSASDSTAYEKNDILRISFNNPTNCDVNGDHVTDVADIATVISVMADGTDTYSKKADVNGDGVVDVADIATVISAMASGSGPSISNVATTSGGTIGDAFYVYRNDKQFNAFFREKVDSIVFSYYDTNNILRDKIASQIVYTPDSVYNIPLMAVDSISFVSPATKYKPGVIRIEGELRKYVLRQDSLTLFFSSNIPTDLIPHAGDKLVTLEMSDTFPIGFAGQVATIKNVGGEIEVTCVPVGLREIFETYYGVSKRGRNGKELGESRTYPSRRHETYAPGKKTLNLIDNHDFELAYNKNDELSLDVSELKANVSVTPVINADAIVVVNLFDGVYVNVSVSGDFDLEEEYSFKGGLSWQKDIKIFREYWIVAPLVDFYVELGGFIKAEGEFAIQKKHTQKYRSDFHYEYKSWGDVERENVCKVTPVSSTNNGEAFVNGTLGGGAYFEAGFDFIFTDKLDLGNAKLRAELGVNLEGNVVPTKNDMVNAMKSTALYEKLRDKELSVNWFYGIKASARFWKWEVEHNLSLDSIKLSNQGRIRSYAIAPTFSDVKAYYSEESKKLEGFASVSCLESVDGCLPVSVGFLLKDEDDDIISLSKDMKAYNGSQGKEHLKSELSSVSIDLDNCKVYPFFSLMGFGILASPCGDIHKIYTSCPDENHPHTIDLGLPSGTLWACCNVGADTPEGYGNYYAWGEASPKDVYNEATYKYYNSSTGYVNIGSDIAGTSYDAAAANWGSPWHMPTKTQCNELLTNCTHHWTFQNGVGGWGLTGSNGGTIFLPEAGSISGSKLGGVGTSGFYWSSTFYESYKGHTAWGISFGSGVVKMSQFGGREDGHSVRPVQ